MERERLPRLLHVQEPEPEFLKGMIKMPLRTSRLFVVPVIAAGLIAGMGVSAALAQSSGSLPFLHKSGDEYPRNAAGMTYGSALDAQSPDSEPDLILVIAANGEEGYAKKVDLANAEGSGFTSPEEALAWQASRDGSGTPVTVYASDGTTPIGTFVVGGE